MLRQQIYHLKIRRDKSYQPLLHIILILIGTYIIDGSMEHETKFMSRIVMQIVGGPQLAVTSIEI